MLLQTLLVALSLKSSLHAAIKKSLSAVNEVQPSYCHKHEPLSSHCSGALMPHSKVDLCYHYSCLIVDNGELPLCCFKERA